ncbi:zinc finger, CCHC-type containing protein [Tanacetum coccineum]|uniref:Zinc finger, CCHC-type containing protein n=1 Tax=Tanacetum coccineum TaxID=301880 RepID=A0ABQ4Z6T8_9ASTR
MAEDASSKKLLVSNFTNYKITDSRPVMEQHNELLSILDFKHTLKHKKEELTLVELDSHLRIEESLRMKDSDKQKKATMLNIVNDNIASPFMSTSKLNDSILWHARLGHVHFKRMQDMSKNGLIPAFDMDTEKCKICMLDKITKKSFQNVKRESKVLEMIQSDLCDLYTTPSLGNKKYFVNFIDDASRFCYVYLLHSKDETLDKFKVFKTEVELQQGSQIKRFRTDRGGEYMDTLYFQSVGLSQGFWGEAMLTNCYLLNMVLNKRNRITPYELWTKKKPNLNYLRVWGCRAVVRLPDPKLETLGERGIECIFVGYAEYSKAFRFYVIEPNDSVSINSIIESRDAIFDENKFSSVPRPSQRSLVNGTEDIGCSVVPEEVTEEVVHKLEPELRKIKRNRTPKDFGPKFQLYLIEGTRNEKEAINDEMDSIMGNNTWVLADLPPSCKPLGCKWFFKRKLKVDETIEKFKARLVIQGFKQKSGIDYFDTYAPIKNFLEWDLDEDLGTKQWHQKFDEVVLSNGYLLNQADKIQDDMTKEFFGHKFSYEGVGEAGVILGNWIKHEVMEISISRYYIENMYNGKSRHLSVKHSMIRDLITNGVISIEFVRSQQNLVDHLTKELARDYGYKVQLNGCVKRNGRTGLDLSSLIGTTTTTCSLSQLAFIPPRFSMDHGHLLYTLLEIFNDKDVLENIRVKFFESYGRSVKEWFCFYFNEIKIKWPGNANMAFDLRPTEDVLPWPGNANMAFDLRPTEDVLPWPGNANMAFDLRPTEDVLLWPGNANMAFDLVPDLQCLLRTFYIQRYLRDMHEDNYNGIVIPL